MKKIFSAAAIIFIFSLSAVFAAEDPATVVITIEPIKNSAGVIIAYRALDPKTGKPLTDSEGNQMTFKGPTFPALAYPQFNAMKAAYEANINVEFTFDLTTEKVTLNKPTAPPVPAKPAGVPSDWTPVVPTPPAPASSFITPKGRVVEVGKNTYVVEYEVPDPANPRIMQIFRSPRFNNKVDLDGFKGFPPIGTNDVYYRDVIKNGKLVGQELINSNPPPRIIARYNDDGDKVGQLITITTWVEDEKGIPHKEIKIFKSDELEFDDDVRDTLFPPVAPPATAPTLTAKPTDAPVVKPAEPAPVKAPTWDWNKIFGTKPAPEKPESPTSVPVSTTPPKDAGVSGRKPRTKTPTPPAAPVKPPAPVAPPVVTNPQMIQYRDAAPRTLIEEPLPLTDTKPKYTFTGAVFTPITDDKGDVTGYNVKNVSVMTCPTPAECKIDIIAEIMVNGATVDEAKKNIKNNDFLQGLKK